MSDSITAAKTLAVRLDSAGDVLLTGPAIRALAHGSAPQAVDLLVSPAGEAAARLLPGAGDVLVFDPPWSGYQPVPVEPGQLTGLIHALAIRRYRQVVIFTSFHQSPLPMALIARMAGVPHVAADCEDYPGSLLDVRHQRAEVHEVTAALELAAAAGFSRPPGDDGCLKVHVLQPDSGFDLPEDYIVIHPEASVPARSLGFDRARDLIRAVVAAGWPVVVTGGRPPSDQARHGLGTIDLRGQTSFGQLAGVLAGAACTVAVNSGPAHLSAATGTPVVSLFSPVVPAARWAPFGVPVVLLGDQLAACRGSRARSCPVPGHPCLNDIDPATVVAAIAQLAQPGRAAPPVLRGQAGAA